MSDRNNISISMLEPMRLPYTYTYYINDVRIYVRAINRKHTRGDQLPTRDKNESDNPKIKYGNTSKEIK